MDPYGTFLMNFTHVVGNGSPRFTADSRKLVVDLALRAVVLQAIRARWG